MKEQLKDTRLNVNIIKGIAILGVVIGHYLNSNTEINAFGYAYHWIILFYLTSGYGIYYSLQKRFSGNVQIGKIATYYFDRFMRIMPLFYLVIGLFVISFKMPFPNIYTLLGIRTQGAWFIASIMHCYLFSVPLFYLMRKLGNRSFLIILSVGFFATLVFHAAFLNDISSLSEKPFVYLDFFSGHIYIFGLGMLLARMKDALFARPRLIVAFAVFLLTFVAARAVRGGALNSMMNVLYIFAAMWFVGVFIHSNLKSNVLRIFDIFGRYSLGIYLIHSKVLAWFANSGLLIGNDLWSIYMLAVIIPVVLVVAVLLELFVNSLVHSAKYEVLTS
ncbi:MAG: acyltransferase family protein [Candidatus Dojkabacteria bacterium]